RGVDADDEMAPGVQLSLELVGGIGDLALEPSLLDGNERTLEHRTAAETVEVPENVLGLALHLIGERLDVPRPTEWIGDGRHPRLVRQHLLRAQRQSRGLVAREGERL